jgi:hypothetical protein
MGKAFAELDETNVKWIKKQRMFFVATAPTAVDGLLNLSPKGLDAFAVIDPTTAAYLDIVGSGVETIAHVKQNGRLIFMFCAFEGPPRILRLWGKGEVIERADARWPEMRERFPEMPGERSIIVLHIARVQDSCGYGVPRYAFEEDRTTLTDWAVKKGPDAVDEYIAKNNEKSIDSLPGLPVA